MGSFFSQLRAFGAAGLCTIVLFAIAQALLVVMLIAFGYRLLKRSVHAGHTDHDVA